MHMAVTHLVYYLLIVEASKLVKCYVSVLKNQTNFSVGFETFVAKLDLKTIVECRQNRSTML